MDDKKQLKKYFIKDVELNSVEEDLLNYKDILNNLETIIENTEAPFNVAITGKSGSGKSSIINFLVDKYRKNSTNYNIEKVNVWKDNVSIKQYLESNLEKDDSDLQSEEIQNENPNEKDEIKSGVYKPLSDDGEKRQNSKNVKAIVAVCNAVLTFVGFFFLTSLVFLVKEYMESKSKYPQGDLFFTENTYLDYCESLGIIMLIACGLTCLCGVISRLIKRKKKVPKYNINNYKSGTIEKSGAVVREDEVQENANASVSGMGYTNGSASTTDYTNVGDMGNANFSTSAKGNENAGGKVNTKISAITNTNSSAIANAKNIIIVEDIDKLSIAEMLRTLEDIRYCGDYKKYIFIVPLDKDILMQAIEIRNKIKVSGKYKPMKFEKVMDKIFQFKLHMPEISEQELEEYAVKITRTHTPDFIEEYINTEVFETVIRNVLVYKNVTTPRHIKKLINNFVSNKILAYSKLDSGIIGEDLINAKDFDIHLAKISVLQSDFEEFYDLLFKNFDYLDELTKLYSLNIEDLKKKYNEVDDELKPFLKVKYKPLKMFLRQTRRYKISNLANLMYLTKNTNEKMYKGIPISSYIAGGVDFSKLENNDVLDLINMMKSEEDLQIPAKIMLKLMEKLEENLTCENYQVTFEFIRDNSDCFYEENGNVSKYVHFLINYIGISPNPDEIIKELDDNFTRIGNVYELNNNIKGLDNIDYDKAYEFMAKCLDNGDLDRMTYVINRILSDENSIDDALMLEKKMKKYSLIDYVESNIDDIIEAETIKLGLYATGKADNSEEVSESDKANSTVAFDEEQIDEKSKEIIEKVENLEKNYTLLQNIIEICVLKQIHLSANDVIKIIEKALKNITDSEYELKIYAILKKFDRDYFYEIRRDFNEIIYSNFHETNNSKVKKTAIACTRYFKNTKLFRTKLTKEELKFYTEN